MSPHIGADEKEVRLFFLPKFDKLIGPRQTLRQTTTIIRAFAMLSIAMPDAVILVAERSLVVPALILVLHRESTKVWGVHADLEDPISYVFSICTDCRSVKIDAETQRWNSLILHLVHSVSSIPPSPCSTTSSTPSPSRKTRQPLNTSHLPDQRTIQDRIPIRIRSTA